MANIKKVGMAAGTFSAALGIGFIMQNGDALANRFGAEPTEQPAPFIQAAVVDVAKETPDTVTEQTMSTSAELVADAVPVDQIEIAMVQTDTFSLDVPALSNPEPDLTIAVNLPEQTSAPVQSDAGVLLANLDLETAPTPDIGDPATVEIYCVPDMSATIAQAAMVVLSVSAPCHVNTMFTVHHQGMMFTSQTDEDGDVTFDVPALAEVAVFIAAFEDGNGAVATATVPEFGSFDRAVLQWQGDVAVTLNAYEGAADFGDSTHIHAGNTGDLTRVIGSEGGFLVRLGKEDTADAFLAEVYTYPSGMIAEPSDVFLMAETEITDENCGREVSAQSIQVSPSGETSALDLTMVMPECDAVGDFLILQNMFKDLTIATR